MSSALTTLSPTTSPTFSPETILRDIRIELSLALLMKISGVVSCVSSFLLARHVLKSKKTWSDISLTNMMLVGISISDYIGSFLCFVLGNWMTGEIPWHNLNAFLYAGNTQTCTAQGFFGTLTTVYSVSAYSLLGSLCE